MALNSSLKVAIQALSISDVVLKSINAEISDSYENELPGEGSELSLQHVFPRRLSTKIYLPTEPEIHDHRKIVYEMLAGMRVLAPREGGFDGASPEEIESHVCATIRCVFLVSYEEVRIEETQFVNEEALDEFGKHNAPFNVWPYWREVAQSASSRMGLPRIVLPPFRLKKGAIARAMVGSTEVK